MSPSYVATISQGTHNLLLLVYHQHQAQKVMQTHEKALILYEHDLILALVSLLLILLFQVTFPSFQLLPSPLDLGQRHLHSLVLKLPKQQSHLAWHFLLLNSYSLKEFVCTWLLVSQFILLRTPTRLLAALSDYFRFVIDETSSALNLGGSSFY